jgi:hypothetical protein
MKIAPNNELKKRLVKKYWKLTRRVFVAVREQVIERSEHIDPERLKPMVRDMLDSKKMNELINTIWAEVGGKYGYDTENAFKRAKGGKNFIETKDKDKLTIWQERMRKYSAERSIAKVSGILDAETDAINSVIDEVMDSAFTSGMSVQDARRLLKKELEGDKLATIENWEAERIARTEIGSASSTASYEAAMEGDLTGVMKQWFTSGLPGVRETHQYYESLGDVEPDYEFAPGLKFPLDSDCEDAGDVINCRCDLIYSVGNE